MTTYQPTGTGLCARCGHDVGRHDAGHGFLARIAGAHYCGHGPDMASRCCEPFDHPIHDVGRVLRCPGGESDE